ncbi:MAG: DUF4194 domain-containing protein [Actinomycetota bacterium]|nr:DUF4194 domain-containing protein [Actinomycetota bacterium]
MNPTELETPNLSIAAIALMKGVVYRDTHEQAWLHVLRLRPQLVDHMAVLGLDVRIDEAEGWAYLHARADDPEQPLPRLIPRHKLSLLQSLLLALLRKALLEFDATEGVGRLVLRRERIIADLRTFLGDSPNEARLVDQVDATIGKIVDLGYLRQVKGTSGASAEYEVRRILKAFIDGQWLNELDARLQEYAASLGLSPEQGGSDDR